MSNGLVNRILVADDDPVIRRVIQRAIEVGGWNVQAVADGDQAWAALIGADPPRIAVLDWQMPGVEGIELCRRVRERADSHYAYLLMLTARTRTEDVVVALDAGADDYIMKPFHAEELRSRLRVAERIIHLEASVEERVRELEGERRRSAQLEGLLPICMHCKRIRDEHQQWAPLEEYIGQRTEATFTHGLCDDCHRRLHDEEMATRRAG
jgi:phosphoserine phosphatase RsbU/P